jgi:hypothetical protein
MVIHIFFVSEHSFTRTGLGLHSDNRRCLRLLSDDRRRRCWHWTFRIFEASHRQIERERGTGPLEQEEPIDRRSRSTEKTTADFKAVDKHRLELIVAHMCWPTRWYGALAKDGGVQATLIECNTKPFCRPHRRLCHKSLLPYIFYQT